jgi:hypothetical protein
MYQTDITVVDASVKTSDRKKEEDNNLVFSYLTMRNLIGLSGMLLPFLLMFTTGRTIDDSFIEPSISDYYYTTNGDVLVVLLSVLGVFLFTYNGYTWQEKALTTLAALCGIGVAFSPTATDSASTLSIHISYNTVPMIFGIERHFIFAATFFVCLAIISLKFFPKTDAPLKVTSKEKKTPKEKRNTVYITCGWIIIVCVALLAAYFFIKPDVGDFPLIFTLEAVAVEAFGFSWITKGETLWPDGEHYVAKAYRHVKEKLKKVK